MWSRVSLATWKVAQADLRARRGQALITVVVVAGVVASLLLATMLLQGAVNPWQQLFARTRGADVLIYFQNGTNTKELRYVAGIREIGKPYQAASATLEQGAVRSPVELRAMTPAPPAMSAPLLVAGTWLRPWVPAGVVLEASFAEAVHLGVGDRIVVDGIDGTLVHMRVIGIADTADQGFYPQWTPGLIWVQHGLLASVEPSASETQEIVGLRLYDSSTVATGEVVQTIWNLYNGSGENSAVERYSTWQQVKDSMASNDRLLGLLLALFGIIALVAAPCAIANVTAGRVLVQRQDIAMLKALGFTPGQVVRMLLAEQTLLGAAGAAARAYRRADHHLGAVRQAAGRHAGRPRAAVRRLDGADRRGYRSSPSRSPPSSRPGGRAGCRRSPPSSRARPAGTCR